MRCDAVRRIVEEGTTITPAAQVHITSCSSCKDYLRQWERIHTGLVVLRDEAPPEPMVGFTNRLMRRLEMPAPELQLAQQFVVQVGRRIVYATLMVALTLLLVLLLPSSGPFRSSGVSQSILVQVQAATLSNEQMLGVGDADNSGMPDSSQSSANSSSSGGRQPK